MGIKKILVFTFALLPLSSVFAVWAPNSTSDGKTPAKHVYQTEFENPRALRTPEQDENELRAFLQKRKIDSFRAHLARPAKSVADTKTVPLK